MPTNTIYLITTSAFVIGIIGFIYVIKKLTQDNYGIKFKQNSPMIIDRRYEKGSKYNLYKLGEIHKIPLHHDKIRLWVKPLDYEINNDGAIKVIEKDARTECLLVIKKSDLITVKSGKDGSVALYEINSKDSNNYEIQLLREQLYRSNQKFDAMEEKYLSLLAKYANDETDEISSKKIGRMVKNTTDMKAPATEINLNEKKQ